MNPRRRILNTPKRFFLEELMFKKRGMIFRLLIFGLGLGIFLYPDSMLPTESDVLSGQTRVCVTTYIYKRVGNLEIKADVHQIEDKKKRRVVVNIHGGALITGGREALSNWFKENLFAAGYDIVSIDYRLAPETKLPGIIEDLEDAFRWIYEQGPELLGVDTSKVAVIGGSAGGYLALTAGYRVKPRPAVIVSMWGYGDLVGPWQSEPSTHPSHNWVKMTDEEVQEIMQGPPIANNRDRQGNGWGFYQYCRQHGLWPELAGGWPLSEKEKFYPYMPLKNVTKEYPPTLLIHGTADADVPHEQSEMMEKEFIKYGVPYELFSGKDAGHGFRNAEPKDLERAQELIIEFIKKYMKD